MSGNRFGSDPGFRRDLLSLAVFWAVRGGETRSAELGMEAGAAASPREGDLKRGSLPRKGACPTGEGSGLALETWKWSGQTDEEPGPGSESGCPQRLA